MLVRFDILLQPVRIKSKENAICDCLSRGSVEGFHTALEAWIARGRSTEAYIERVDTVPDTSHPRSNILCRYRNLPSTSVPPY